jgi:hypothetical protein
MVSLQDASQFLPGTEYPHLDVCFAPAGHAGNFPDRFSLQFQQCDHQPFIGAQQGKSPFEKVPRLLIRQVYPVCVIRTLIVEFVQRDIPVFLLSSAQRILTGSDRDACEPVLEWRIMTEFAQMLIDFYKNILANVIQFVCITGKTCRKGENFMFVSADQLDERRIIAGNDILNEAIVRSPVIDNIH